MPKLIKNNGCGCYDESCPDFCYLDIDKGPAFGGCQKYLDRAHEQWRKHQENVLLIKEINRRSAEYDE